MDAEQKQAVKSIDRSIRDLKRLRADMVLAYELEWSAPRGPVDAKDPGIRSRGGLSDPTGDTAVNGSRLKLREALKGSERHVEALSKATDVMSTWLAFPLRAYETTGEDAA